ncbi:hypothetical protein [Streptomyces sp. S.PNR 29]|uniref:hypothetical protein n=1 Tax=Streptomyces sp. S.PNR 29 TaxID=2973805 RepID=UPI0025B125D3|nr:hypothetical protein [Streptomyces sp. S.PNR 29]MDN0193897.1 60S ribosomal protein L18 [Streptomyces sp. S.PNR 29]
MGQGIAGVVGAVVGLAGAVGVGLLTRAATLRQTREAASAQLDQWRYSVRRDTYSAFLAAITTLSVRMRRTYNPFSPPDPGASSAMVDEMEETLGQALGLLLMEATPEVAAAGEQVIGKFVGVMTAALRITDAARERAAGRQAPEAAVLLNGMENARNAVEEAKKHFIDVARKDLHG